MKPSGPPFGVTPPESSPGPGDGSGQPPINVRPYAEPFSDHVFGGVKVLVRRNESGETIGWHVDWSEVYGKEQRYEFNEPPASSERERQDRQVVQAVARAGVNIHSIYDFVKRSPRLSPDWRAWDRRPVRPKRHCG